MAQEDIVVEAAPIEQAEVEADKPPVITDLKRKLDDLNHEQQESDKEAKDNTTDVDAVVDLSKDDATDTLVQDSKKPRLEEERESDGSVVENGHEVEKSDVSPVENAETASDMKVEVENVQNVDSVIDVAENPQNTSFSDVDSVDVKHVTVETTQLENAENQPVEIRQEGDALNSADETPKTEDVQHPTGNLLQLGAETSSTSRKMEVPNNKVGVLIGKAGDTIRTLQLNSGAKIQIARDAEADPSSATRPVELIGSLESINKAEKLIKDVIAEAEAGGSPALVAKGFGTVQGTGAVEQTHIQVPNEKVGMIIGKGGDTIKNLQTRSGARIQLIPQHLPEGDLSRERTVRLTGDKKQIALAKEMIDEVMNQPARPSHHSGGYNQQGYRPRGPSAPHQWGARGHPSAQSTVYGSHQRGMYSAQNTQYMPPNYAGYSPQQTAPRSHFNAGWDHRPGPMHATPPQSGYDHYTHGGHVADPSVPAPMANSGPIAPATHGQYNYGQPQGPDYGQHAHYPQSAPSQQNYGHGYDEQKYANQGPTQPAYGGHGNGQPGAYPPQTTAQPGYAQQAYSKPPAYGVPPQGAPQAYGPPRPGQPGDVPYQNPAYGQNVPAQQPYPYPTGGQAQQAYPYNSAPPADGYSQPPTHSASAPVYSQPGGQTVAAYGHPGGQMAPVYSQGGQSGGYGPYSSQPGYGEQPVPNNAAYGYQGSDTSYSAPTPAYGATPAAQTNYVQPTANPPTYEQQPAPQSGAYSSVPGSAPGHVKNISPQPVYGQYDSTQMYGGQQ